MLHYVVGNATEPQGAGPKVIAHICNTVGGWGLGFVRGLSKRWSQPEDEYRKRYRSFRDDPNGWFLPLGDTQFVKVGKDLWVANMVAQKGLRGSKEGPPIRYEALEICLSKLWIFATEKKASIHMPRIGIGFAGGDWNVIEPLLQAHLDGHEVFIYTLEE